jgi:diguanylate cyclase (GGDEF)-like protein
MIKYRVHEVGKDFGKTSKEITQILTDYATTPKNHMQVLEDPELNVIFEYLTQHNQIESLEEVFKVPPKPKEAAPAAESKDGKAAAPETAAPAAPKKEKENKPHVPRKVAEKRVVDTRGATTNLSKYDQHLDDLADDQRAKNLQKKGGNGKQKIQNRDRQRRQNAQQAASNKRKQEELEKNLAALQIEKSEYEKSSKEDPLTGCLNRAGFSSILLREQENLSKNGCPVSFVMLDIDHFKEVNDTYGHSVGDEVLVNLTRLIRDKIRNTDALVRWGGEEFVILCGDTPIQNAQFLAEKLRHAIETTQLIKQQVVTCSFGIAEMVAGEDPKRLFDRADKALYASKQAGRNRVTSATFKKSESR